MGIFEYGIFCKRERRKRRRRKKRRRREKGEENKLLIKSLSGPLARELPQNGRQKKPKTLYRCWATKKIPFRN